MRVQPLLPNTRKAMDENRPQWVEPSQDSESRLAIDLLPGERKHPRLWVFVHGFVSHRRGEKALFFREQLQARGEAFASLDLTGHGDSDGDLFGLTMSRNLSDLDRRIALRAERARSFFQHQPGGVLHGRIHRYLVLRVESRDDQKKPAHCSRVRDGRSAHIESGAEQG